MAMTKCRECQADISTQAVTCPKCGAKVPKAKGCGTVILILISIWLGLAFLGEVVSRVRGTMPGKASTGTSSPPALPAPPPREPDPVIELLSFRCETNSIGTAWVYGRVRNISSGPIKAAWAVASFYTKSGQFIASDESVLDINPLLPGQESGFSISGPRNPEFSKCGMDGFKTTFGPQIPWREAAKKPGK